MLVTCLRLPLSWSNTRSERLVGVRTYPGHVKLPAAGFENSDSPPSYAQKNIFRLFLMCQPILACRRPPLAAIAHSVLLEDTRIPCAQAENLRMVPGNPYKSSALTWGKAIASGFNLVRLRFCRPFTFVYAGLNQANCPVVMENKNNLLLLAELNSNPSPKRWDAENSGVCAQIGANQ